MNNADFTKVVDDQLAICSQLLTKKGQEYSTEVDRLQHFKKAGAMMGVSPKTALLGMLSKHLISVSDMCQSETKYPTLLWDEKITDTINYMLLLKALVMEEAKNG